MSPFQDIGRMVVEASIISSLGEDAGRFDVEALVNDYVEQFGFTDLDEVETAKYMELLSRHDKARNASPN